MIRVQCQHLQKLKNVFAVSRKPKNCQQLLLGSRKLTFASTPTQNCRKTSHQEERTLSCSAFCHTSRTLFPQNFCKKTLRQFSNSCHLASNSETGNSDKSGIDHREEEQPPDWIHPSTREDSILKQDLDLKSLLHDLASDFGEDVSHDKKNSVEETHGSNEPNKAVRMGSCDDMGIVYFDGSGSDGGFGKVKSDVDEELKQAGNDENREGSLKRKLNGVLSISEIVDILREDNARDICVIKVPKEKQYVDYFVVVTGRSSRHLKAMTMYLNKIYKHLKKKGDPFIKVEGKDTDDWLCIDFGDIVIHFMLEETRQLYELEMLWTLGPEHDDQFHRIVSYQSTIANPMLPNEEELEELQKEWTHQ